MKLGAVAYSHVRAPTSAASVLDLDQRGSRSSALARAVLLIPVAAVGLLPFAWFAAEASRQPDLMTAMADRPGSALMVLMGLLIVAGLVAMPAVDIANRFAARRSVRIADGTVTVAEQGAFGSAVWTEPLAKYIGLAHHIRASLSGARHEIVLVHPDRNRSILLAFDMQVRESELQAMAAQLELPVVPARLIYEPRRVTALPTGEQAVTA